MNCSDSLQHHAENFINLTVKPQLRETAKSFLSDMLEQAYVEGRSSEMASAISSLKNL